MRSDSELLVLFFHLKKRWARFVRSPPFCKTRRDKTGFVIPMAEVVRFWPKVRRLDPSHYRIENDNGINQVEIFLRRAGPLRQLYEELTKVYV